MLRNRSLAAATLGHFSVDMYSGMLPLVLLALTDPLRLAYAQIGFVSMLFSLTSSLSQPVFGWLGDRRWDRALAVVGIAAIAVTMGILRFADQYAMLLLLTPIAGLGSGAFHPQGAVLAAQASPERRGSAMSVFMLGGNLGFAVGPLIGTFAFSVAGALLPQAFALFGFLQAALIFWVMAAPRAQPAAKTASRAIKPAARAATGVIATLALVIFLRAWVTQSVSIYIPQVVKAQGFSTEFAGNVLFSILLPLAIGGLIGGTLSDRIGRRRVLIFSTALIAPALWGMLQVTGAPTLLIAPLLGVAMGASLPVTVVMAQQLIPRGMGMMSGVILGFTFIAGAIGVSASGLIADQIGLLPAMTVNALLPLGAAGLAVLLPEDQPAAARIK